MGLLLLLGLFAICVTIGLPVAFALAVSEIATFAYEGLPLLVGFKRIVSGMSIFSLLAIPFFIFGGELMLRGGIATRLIPLAAAACGWRSEEHTSELRSLIRLWYAVFCVHTKR